MKRNALLAAALAAALSSSQTPAGVPALVNSPAPIGRAGRQYRQKRNPSTAAIRRAARKRRNVRARSPMAWKG